MAADGIHQGGPSPALIEHIQSLTIVDHDGRQYFRKTVWDGWRRLRTAADFRELNAAIDAGRES